MIEFRIDHRRRTGEVVKRGISDYLSLQYYKHYKQPGSLQLAFPPFHPLSQTVEKLDQLELWWRDAERGIDWHRDFLSLVYAVRYNDRDDQPFMSLAAVGDKAILKWRIVAYKAGLSNLSAFSQVPAETIMKSVIDMNFTALATSGPEDTDRTVDGDLFPIMGMNVRSAPDLGRGNLITRRFSNANVHEVLAEILDPISGGDFSFERVEPATWELDFHPGQLGENKSIGDNRVVFSRSRGNIANVRRSFDISELASIAIVGGGDTGVNREYEVVAAPWASDYHIETFVNAAAETSAGLISAGLSRLDRHRPKEDFGFDVVQTESVFYAPPVPGRITYQVGDLVRVELDDRALVGKIASVVVIHSQENQVPRINVDIEEVQS